MSDVRAAIEAAAVAPAWPTHSFVTANPLAGLEDRPFHEAVARGQQLFGGRGYPAPDMLRRAWTEGRIEPGILRQTLAEYGFDEEPAELAQRLTTRSPERATPDWTAVNATLSKWLAAFTDQGSTEWPMPDREAGFYRAFLTVARHDRAIPNRERLDGWPDEPTAAVERALADVPADRWEPTLEAHLAALPGWTGLIERRAADKTAWQAACPVTLTAYLAARLALVDVFEARIEPPAIPDPATDRPLADAWLTAWERSYRQTLLAAIADEADEPAPDRPDAQLVFCIDTRSEVIRRHVERVGDYETHGYAGFFGVPMRYDGYSSPETDACPPIVDPVHEITEEPRATERRASYDRWTAAVEAGRDLLESLESNAATAFGFVESAGAGYGLGLAGRTLLPGRLGAVREAIADRLPATHEVTRPAIDELSLADRVAYAATAFELMGITEFARVVAFVGHASRTANNPFDASLDCGACAGNPGGPNARTLAAICNQPAVRAELRDRGIDVPDDTVFLAGQHTTTTDEIELYDADAPESHQPDIDRLRADLADARVGAASERVGGSTNESAADSTGEPAGGSTNESAVREATRRAHDWAETRPEWGLAGNAAFVIGPRSLTAGLDLDARVFLHSYDPAADADGTALESILTGPLVVAQWINSAYYFATVDPETYGSGSKVTQNPVGNVGVYQGNGGDLQTGLPAQSVLAAADRPYHQPLRLSAVVYAPRDRVTAVLADHESLTSLLDDDWLSLTVVEPDAPDRPVTYQAGLDWERLEEPGLLTADSPT